MPQPPDDHIRLALAHVSAACEGLERTIHEAYADAAYDARITAYGNICAKRALLQRIRADLNLLQRSVSAPGLLAAES
jgi:hypothetical protein